MEKIQKDELFVVFRKTDKSYLRVTRDDGQYRHSIYTKNKNDATVFDQAGIDRILGGLLGDLMRAGRRHPILEVVAV
jgi:hypothetical protein